MHTVLVPQHGLSAMSQGESIQSLMHQQPMSVIAGNTALTALVQARIPSLTMLELLLNFALCLSHQVDEGQALQTTSLVPAAGAKTKRKRTRRLLGGFEVGVMSCVL
jgi:hypothetical protein